MILSGVLLGLKQFMVREVIICFIASFCGKAIVGSALLGALLGLKGLMVREIVMSYYLLGETYSSKKMRIKYLTRFCNYAGLQPLELQIKILQFSVL